MDRFVIPLMYHYWGRENFGSTMRLLNGAAVNMTPRQSCGAVRTWHEHIKASDVASGTKIEENPDGATLLNGAKLGSEPTAPAINAAIKLFSDFVNTELPLTTKTMTNEHNKGAATANATKAASDTKKPRAPKEEDTDKRNNNTDAPKATKAWLTNKPERETRRQDDNDEYRCALHGVGNHSTERCNTLRNVREQAGVSGRPSTLIDEGRCLCCGKDNHETIECRHLPKKDVSKWATSKSE